MRAIWNFVAVVSAFSICAAEHPPELEAVMDEVIVEAPFDVRLQLPNESHVQLMIDRLTLKAEMQREMELRIANRTPLNTLLDLTKYSPIPIGASDNRVDTFFLENYMRADLNPREDSSLFRGK